MSAERKPEVVLDPAGLDQLLLAAGKGVTRWLEAKLGSRVNLWDGEDGLGNVLEEHIAAAKIPNKRLPDLLTPRMVVRRMAAPNPMPAYVKKRMKRNRKFV